MESTSSSKTEPVQVCQQAEAEKDEFDGAQMEIENLMKKLELAPKGPAGKKARNKLRKKIEKLREMKGKSFQERGSKCCGNYVRKSTPGCHVAHMRSDWVIGTESWEEGMFGDGVAIEELEEISIDPETGMLSVISSESQKWKCFNISMGGACLPIFGKGDVELEVGVSKDGEGRSFPCVSLVLVLPPQTVMDVCYLSAMPTLTDSNRSGEFHTGESFLVSDIKLLSPIIPFSGNDFQVDHLTAPVLEFPLKGQGPFLCSQGMGGQFTHFFPSNFYAVDFECPIGTPVLAVADGIVVEVRDSETVEGILTTNLFKWNSILLKISEDLFIDYVHIKANSAVVQVGQTVKCGDLLCESGSVGFSPTPHLHFQVSRSQDADAHTIPFLLKALEYSADGQLVDPPKTSTTTSSNYLVPQSSKLYSPLP